MENIKKHFGKGFSENERVKSYNLIENYISLSVKDWSSAPDTDSIAIAFNAELKNLDDSDFCFLLCHTGYIPEIYSHDSSQETLYSKLIEVLVCEWAKRVGFKDSMIVKQKSSKEDVTIQQDNIIIVCDAKSYRLGRSQAAPNVKDVIKKADYDKWKSNYKGRSSIKHGLYETIGGLITFPSLHKWKGKSDAYLYSTDKDDPIVILFYEYLSFYLLKKYNYSKLISLYNNYDKVFPIKSDNQENFNSLLINFLFKDDLTEFIEYLELFKLIIKEKVKTTINNIEDNILQFKDQIEKEIEIIPVAELKQRLIESLIYIKSHQLKKQVININKFRPC